MISGERKLVSYIPKRQYLQDMIDHIRRAWIYIKFVGHTIGN